MYIRKRFKSCNLLVWSLALFMVGCSTTRQIEKKQSNEVYKTLGLKQERKDNLALYKEASSWLNVPHRGGGLSKKGVDCSGLVHEMYKNVYSKNIGRNSLDILKKNCNRIGKNRLREGDLVFFNSGNGSKTIAKINHVGIYLKDHKFLHASTSRGVIVSDLEDEFYRNAWVCGGRVKD